MNGSGAVAPDEVGVEPPTELLIEAFGPIDIRDRQDGDFELHFDPARFRGRGYVLMAWISRVHFCLLGWRNHGLPWGREARFSALSIFRESNAALIALIVE